MSRAFGPLATICVMCAIAVESTAQDTQKDSYEPRKGAFKTFIVNNSKMTVKVTIGPNEAGQGWYSKVLASTGNAKEDTFHLYGGSRNVIVYNNQGEVLDQARVYIDGESTLEIRRNGKIRNSY